jgi:hypothetical protein
MGKRRKDRAAETPAEFRQRMAAMLAEVGATMKTDEGRRLFGKSVELVCRAYERGGHEAAERTWERIEKFVDDYLNEGEGYSVNRK